MAAVLFFAGVNNAFAAVTVTAATGGGAISADTNTTNGTATWTTLTGPTIAEGAFRDFPNAGTFILTAPSGFSFNTGAAVTATITRTAGTGSCFAFTSTTATPAASTVTFTLNAQDGNPGTTRCHVVFSNIQVRPTAGTPLATGNMTKSGTATVSGITSGTTNLGTLTEVAGAKHQLVYTTQPPAAATTSVNFATNPVIHLEDQYGNTETSDSASTIGLAPVLSTQACGGTAGSGAITSTPASGAAVTAGIMTYTAMQYSTAQSIKICATSSGVTSALSSAVTVNSPPAPTITSLSATSAIAGTSAFTLTVNGANYVASSTVDWNGSARTTTFVSASQLTATINAADIASVGTSSITVVNPAASGGTSSAQTFTVSAMPSSLIIFKSATSTSLNGASTTITVNKPTGVIHGDTEVAMISYRPNTETVTAPTGWVLENNQTNSFDDADGMATYVLLAGASEPSSYTWTLSSGSTGSAGAIEDFSGVSPTTPVNAVSSTAPLDNSYTQNAPSVTSTISGAMVVTGYSDANADSWNGVFDMIQDIDAASAVVPNAVGESLSINHVVQAAAGATGVNTATVSSLSDASDAGQAVTLALQPGHAVPTTISISPTSTTAGGAQFTLTVNGTGFDSSSVVDINGSPRTTTFVSYTQVTAVITAADITAAGTSSITIVNPTPGGGTSNAQTLTVNKASTSIAVISSATSSIYGSSVTFTATVTPSAGGPPTGSVTFKDGAITLGTGTLNGANPGVATFSTSTLSVSGSPHSITAVYGGDSNFASSTSSVLSQTITAKSLTVSGITASSKPYDGTTSATLDTTGAALVGVIAGDTVTLNTASAIGTFATSSVGSGITVTVSGLTIAGAQASNYALTQPTTTANITNTVPVLNSISPTSTTAGGVQFTLTVDGSNFLTSSTIYWNGVSLATTFVSDGELTAVVPAGDIAAAGTAAVNIITPAPGGGTSATQTFTINNPVPTTVSISATSTPAGSSDFILTVTGTNFVSGSVVDWNGSSRVTTFVSSSTLTATILAADVATVGTSSITVVNSTPSGGTSNAQTFTVTTAINPAPTLTALSSTSTAAGSAGFLLTLTGTGFISTSQVQWDGFNRTTNFISSTTLTADILDSDLATGGSIPVTVVNSTPGGGTSNAETFAITNPVPTTTSLNPTSTPAGSSDFTLAVTGTDFVSGSVVDWNGSALVTTFVSSSTLTATILAADVAAVGTSSVTVVNPTPGGGTSNAQTFTVTTAINSVPTTSSLSPTSTTAGGQAFTLTVNGANFVASSTVDFNGSPEATTFVSSDQLTATITAINIETGGVASITVVNPLPGGGTSNAQTFTILNPAPTTTLLNPSSTPAGSSDFVLTVSGTDFVSGSVVDWNGSALVTTFVSSSTLTATILAADVAAVGTSSVTVVNPTPGGGTSNAQTFAVTATVNPAPTIISIGPTSTTAGGSGLTLTVTGTNFVSNSVVQWNGLDSTTTFVSSSTLTAAITAADIAAVGTSSVAVVNPTPGGGTSGNIIFTINAPGPGAIKFIFANVTSSAVVGNDVAFNIEAINSSGTIDTSFEQGVTLTVGGSGTGGGLVTIIDGVGTSTVSDDVAQTVALGLQDSQSTGLDVSAAGNITFVPGAVSQFTLNHPGNMNVDTRLGYTVGREDQFGNPVSVSSTVVYLYSNSTSTNAAFFNVPTGGTPITSTIIADGSTSTVFWYYDDSSGPRTVTASDNAVAPDGAAGIADASDTFTVAPGAVQFIFANIPTHATAGDIVTGNVYAVDSSNNIYPSYTAGVTVTISGSAAGGGLINIVNGVGTTTITDLVGETVTIGLRDTQNTGLGVGATVNIVFNPKPLVSSVSTSSTTSVLGGGGGSPSTSVAPGIKPGITITFSGMAYPGASVSVIRKDLGLQAIPTINATPVAADGSFLVELNDVTRLSGQTYLLSFTDRNGLVSQTKAYNIPAQDKLVYGNILAAPTLGFENSSVVTKGQPLVITGYATPKATVELFVDGAAAGTVVVNDPSGKYTYPLDTDSLSFGRHAVWAIQKYAERAVEVSGYENPFSENEIFVNDATNGAVLTKNASGTYIAFIPAQTGGTTGGAIPVTIGATYTKQAESDFSNQQSFTISPLQDPKLDLNGDGVIDIKDLSIFLSYLKTLNAGLTNFHIVDPTLVKVLDFNGDGVVDVNDLNILMAAISPQQQQ